MKASILLNTFRMGGLDISFAGLANQSFPKNDYEVILCDVWYDKRKDAVKKYIKDKGYDIPLVHCKPIRSTYPIDSGSMHRNSAIAYAEGELAIFLCDYSYVKPDWLERHWNIFAKSNKMATAMAPHRYWLHPEVKATWAIEPISIFTEEFTPSMLGKLQPTPEGTQDPKLLLPDGGITYIYFHMKNEAMRLDTLLSINGCDEGYDVDGGHCYSDTDLALRLSCAGNQFVHDSGNIAEIIQVRDFVPFCVRNRTPEQDYAYFKQMETAIHSGRLRANENYNLDLPKLREATLKKKDKQK